jgi:hypothetical protein
MKRVKSISYLIDAPDGADFARSAPVIQRRLAGEVEIRMPHELEHVGARMGCDEFGGTVIADIRPWELINVPNAALRGGRTTPKYDRPKARSLRFRKRPWPAI